MKKTLVLVLLSLFLLVAKEGQAQLAGTPSASQIAQFKKLPKAQQEALAKQYGIDLKSLNMSSSGTADFSNEPAPELQYLTEQNTSQKDNEDEQGNNRKKQSELKPFGYDMFERLQDAFLPNGNIPIPSDYLVGPGDTIELHLFGKESSQYTLTVNNDGQIIIPNLEPISVSGLTYSELKQFISSTVATKMIGIKAMVTLANLRGIQVYVVGDVKNPGAYNLSSLSTLTNALFISGGPNAVGSLRNIQLKRAGKTVAKLDLYKMFTQGDVSQDMRIQQGDVVFVGTIDKQVAISGEVRRPAIYEVFGDETVEDLIEMAGGLNVNAYPKHAILARFDENYQRDVQRINLNNKLVTAQKLKNGDVLTVLPVSDRLDQVVNVAGSVSRPTTYAWSDGMTLSDLIVNKDDLMETTDLNYGLILTQQASGNYEVIQFRPKDVLAGDSEILTPGDLVVFFNRYDQKTFEKSFFESSEQEEIEQPESKQLFDNLGRIDEVFDTEYDLSSQETSQYNYLYAIQNGSLFDKQDALLATKSLSRKDLILPIVKLLSSSSEAGQLIPVVSLTGQVRFPGVYPIAKNAKLADVILAGGGLTESANLSIGEISRLAQNDKEYVSVQHLNFNLIAALSDVEEHNVTLQPRDVINVFQQANWNDELKVTLKGEVKYPGEYTVNEGETLLDVLNRAGGLTENAAVNSAFFTREALKDLEQQQARAMARSLSKELALKSVSSSMTSLNVNEVQTLVANLSEVEGIGRLIIDLESMLSGKSKDIALENGDSLLIPPKRNEINVMGEVQVSTSHIYRSDWTASRYIRSSGGMRAQADEDRVYIIRANGLVDIPNMNQWFGTDKNEYLKPGDTVVVPLDAGHTDNLTLWEKATAIFYQLSVGIVALGRI